MAKAWGDIDEEETPAGKVKLPETQVIEKDGTKSIIEYELVDGKVMKKTKVFRKETMTMVVHKHVLERRKWGKFGKASGHKAGPDQSTTSIGEDVYLVLKSKQEITATEDTSEQDMRKQLAGKAVKCRYCKGDHWSTKCPHKDKLSLISNNAEGGPEGEGGEAGGDMGGPGGPGGRYVPPGARGGARGGDARGDSMNQRDDSSTVRITNLPENTSDADLQELCKPFGHLQRCFLAKDKITGLARGFAFVSYYRIEDAQKCIEALDGYGYDYLILKAEWAKPSEKKPGS
eukprot:m.16207 g.16207  ORF g.16207 m.16207 type:complete len:288 (+) comp5183_c0_seq1:334-1197(+)